MGSVWGDQLKIATFGESHGPAVGVVVDGVPPGLAVDREMIQRDLDRRRPGTSKMVSPRREADRVEILSGVADGFSLGSPICLMVTNTNQRSRDYSGIADRFRPGHADLTYFHKYGLPPQPGGGRSSGRETVGRVAAGALARALLARLGVDVMACTEAVAGLTAEKVIWEAVEDNPLRFADPDLVAEAIELVEAAKADGDSVGGVVLVRATGVPPGLGAPVFDKLEARLGGALLSIGAVKGVEFGAGFALAALRGSAANDAITPHGLASNNCGGTLGGISTGSDIVVRLAVKPTSSISAEQSTIDIHGDPVTISTHGRHDPCLTPRIAPVAEAMTALALADAWLEQRAHHPLKDSTENGK